MALVFGISALVEAIRVNLRGGAAICAAVLCCEILLILALVASENFGEGGRLL